MTGSGGRRPPTTSHNYLRVLEHHVANTPALYTQAKLHRVHVLHDDWCDAVSERGFCNCEPEIRSGALVDEAHP